MRKVKKSDRHKIYKLVLDKIMEGFPYGICAPMSVYATTNFGYLYTPTPYIYKRFPELEKRKPKNASEIKLWWKVGSRRRIQVLKECIEETRPKKKSSGKITNRKKISK